MITFIENFYNTQQLYEVVKNLQFKERVYGEEVIDFNLVPQDLHTIFGSILRQDVSITKDSGVLRKPFENVHFESFNQNSLWIAVVALEQTTFKLHKHKEKNYSKVMDVQGDLQGFIKDNCFDKEKWSDTATITMNAGDLILFKPWLWHSISKSLVKVFYLEANGDKV